MVNARIEAVSYVLPEHILTNEDLSTSFPEWSVEKIASKTGIHTRHVVAPGEHTSDLAIRAAEELFDTHEIDRSKIDFLILCTQSPDFYMPLSAGVVQAALGLRYGIGATDVNLGCSGYIYGLGLAKGLVESGQAASVLLITADTYTRFINDADKSVRTLFGDGASATLVGGTGTPRSMHAFAYGTDGRGAGALIVPNGGLRPGTDISPKADTVTRGLKSNGYDLYMDGPAIFNFTLDVVPESIERVLTKADLSLDDIDLFVFHQANAFMLEHLRKKLKIPVEKFVIALEDSGNTVSSTIPIALASSLENGSLREGMQVMLLGFGVGLSWAGVALKW